MLFNNERMSPKQDAQVILEYHSKLFNLFSEIMKSYDPYCVATQFRLCDKASKDPFYNPGIVSVTMQESICILGLHNFNGSTAYFINSLEPIAISVMEIDNRSNWDTRMFYPNFDKHKLLNFTSTLNETEANSLYLFEENHPITDTKIVRRLHLLKLTIPGKNIWNLPLGEGPKLNFNPNP